jgi:hypothetical protein
MRILLVTSYPPPFDARTRAATAHVRELRADGHVVEVLSPAPSAARHHEELRSWWSFARLVALIRRFDRVMVTEELLDAAPLRAALRAGPAFEPWRPPAGEPISAVEPDVFWPSDRDAAMAEIRARAAHRPMGEPGRAATRDLSAAMRRVPPFVLPDPGSARRGASTVKRVVRRLTGWQVDPLVARMNQLRATLIDEFETLERRDGR